MSTSTNSDASFSSKILCLQEDNAKLAIELSRVKKMAQEASTARQQFEEQQKSSEVRLWAAEGEMEKLREDKIKLSIQVKRLSRRLGKSKREMTVALLALQRCGVVEDSSVLTAEDT